MPVKNHPFSKSNVGDVFAIGIGQNLWGFIRFFIGGAFGVLPKICRECVMPVTNWSNRPERWFFQSWPSKKDLTELIYLGNFQLEGHEMWGPPCFDPPDIFRKSFRVYERGMYRDASQQEVKGMQQCQRLTPQQLCEFLQERLKEGDIIAS